MDISKRVENLLSQMSLEEKIGQMILLSRREKPEKNHEKIIEKYCGNFFNFVDDEEIKNIQLFNAENSRLKIPLLFGIDAIHGHAYYSGATVFPTQLSISCSWSPELVEKMAHVTAKEMRATGIHWAFGPDLDVARDPRWGRLDETFGEDTYLVTKLGAAAIKGLQYEDGREKHDYFGSGKVIACAKHFAGYSETQGGRDATEAELTKRKLKTVFFPPFKNAVENGCNSFMTAYMTIDGVSSTRNTWLLTNILKKDWGFEGFLVTDYDNVKRMIKEHYAFERSLDACIAAVKSGNDMIMATSCLFENLLHAVKEGLIHEDYINRSVSKILKTKFQLGLFENDFNAPNLTKDDVVGCKEHSDICLEATKSSIVLLKNDNNTLPLDKKKIKSISVIGPNADNIANQLGDWTTGNRFQPHKPHPKHRIKTVLEGVRDYIQGTDITLHYSKGCDIINVHNTDLDEFNNAVEITKKSDVAVVVLGEPFEWIGEERDRANLDLPRSQRKLLKALSKTGTPIVLILICGKPQTIHWDIAKVSSILVGFNPGQEGGTAIASILFGDYNPSGKLTVSWPKHVGQIPVYYNHLPGWHASQYVDIDAKPEWPFGFGLSYTQYKYVSMELNKKEFSYLQDTLTTRITIENVGQREGTEIVQLYIRDVVSSVTVPVMQLKGFERVSLKPGEKKDIMIEVKINDLGLITEDLEYKVENGVFLIIVGPNSQDHQLIEKITVNVV